LKLNNKVHVLQNVGLMILSAIFLVACHSLNTQHSALSNASIYFDSDSYIVQDKYKALIEAHSRYLMAHKESHIQIQGNTDERGDSTFNMSVGQKLAESVHALFTLNGVTEAQIETISFGEARPKSKGNDESALAENRRVDIVYK
jgi:peptidoglycan-associated lipoprotein